MCTRFFELILCHGREDFLLTSVMASQVKVWLASEFMGPAVRATGWHVYASVDGALLELVWDEDDECQLHIRLDASFYAGDFILDLCTFAARVGCKLYSPEFETQLEPRPSSVLHRLLRSEAWGNTWLETECIEAEHDVDSFPSQHILHGEVAPLAAFV